MSIFLLSPVEKNVDEKKVSPEKPSEGTPDAKKDGGANEGKTVVPNVGYLPDKEVEEKTIVIDGPLGQIYAKALSETYSKESYITTQPHLLRLNDENEKYDYLYVIDSSQLNPDAEQVVIDSLITAKESYSSVSLFVDHKHNLTKPVTSLLNKARAIECRLFHSSESVMHYFGKRNGKF